MNLQLESQRGDFSLRCLMTRLVCACAVRLCALLWLLLPTAALAANDQAGAAPQPSTALLGLNFGLAVSNQQDQFAASQALAELLGNALHRKVIWQTGFNLANSESSSVDGGPAFSFAFVKPPNLTAALLAKGWHLVAVGKDTLHFGTDLIALPCPGEPGKVLLGGNSLSILGGAAAAPKVCILPKQVWDSPSAVMLTPLRGSLVDQVARKIWREHGANPRQVVEVQTQNAVIGLMRDMHVATVGVVTPVVSKAWAKQGGIVLAHQPMPFWAMLAAPDVSPKQIEAVRGALLSPDAAMANKLLHLPGWENGDPKRYADFLKWLKD